MQNKTSTAIKINNRWEIRSDPYCWVAVEHIPVDKTHHKAKDTGKDTKEYHTYHPSIEACCKFMMKESGKDNCTTLREVLDEQQKLNEQIHSILQ